MSAQISSDEHSDPEAILYLQEAFQSENLIQMILHAHFLIERAITRQIADKLARPEVLETDRWSFYQKIALYVGMLNPPEDREKMLLLACSLSEYSELKGRVALDRFEVAVSRKKNGAGGVGGQG